MILIQRYIFRELVYNFLFSFAVISAVILLAMLLKFMFQNPMLGLGMVGTLIPFLLLGMMQIVVPATALVAVVTTYGRMAADNEILALRSSGVHFSRIVVPGLLFGLLVSLGLLVVTDRYVPLATRNIKALTEAQDVYPLLDNVLKRGKTDLHLNDWVLTWESCEIPDGSGRALSGAAGEWLFKGFRAMRYNEDDEMEKGFYAETATVRAPSRTGKSLVFELHNCRELGGSGARVGEMEIPYELTMDTFKIRLEHRTLAGLFAILDKTPRPYKEYRVLTAIHSRLAHAVSPLVMVFLGLSVAVIFRYRNRMVAFFISLLIAIFVYYPVMLLGETIAENEVLHPALCIWPGSAIMFFGGLWLLVLVAKR